MLSSVLLVPTRVLSAAELQSEAKEDEPLGGGEGTSPSGAPAGVGPTWLEAGALVAPAPGPCHWEQSCPQGPRNILGPSLRPLLSLLLPLGTCIRTSARPPSRRGVLGKRWPFPLLVTLAPIRESVPLQLSSWAGASAERKPGTQIQAVNRSTEDNFSLFPGRLLCGQHVSAGTIQLSSLPSKYGGEARP